MIDAVFIQAHWDSRDASSPKSYTLGWRFLPVANWVFKQPNVTGSAMDTEADQNLKPPILFSEAICSSYYWATRPHQRSRSWLLISILGLDKSIARDFLQVSVKHEESGWCYTMVSYWRKKTALQRHPYTYSFPMASKATKTTPQKDRQIAFEQLELAGLKFFHYLCPQAARAYPVLSLC